MSDYRLTVSEHVDAPRLARVFARGVLEGVDISEDARTAVILMVSDATSDSVRSGNSVTVTGDHTDAGCRLTIQGIGLAPPMVTDMPAGLRVAADERLLEITIGDG